ncbi:hypothetical protein [Saccharothrix australiensis]|uniref:DUF3558 domain-containing protein n=1 Tax=Saccharothrix australiensis TaxID=2072 RepID=A0A495W6I3_9PSEU|nr:hypothetical protein [Saccharothrix australiensis]RKT56687.1 hypothetical protein C8E97_5396 [Saccharothrix australiensis]
MGTRTWFGTAVLAALAVLVACAREPAPAAPPPRIPTIAAPTSVVRTPVMVDRELPEDCELIVPVEVVNQRIGREMAGELKQIIGIPEPKVARTAKIDCYYDVGERRPISTAPLVIGLATYADEAAARERVAESVKAELESGGSSTEVDVGKQKASLVSTAEERLVIGSLGKTTFVARAKAGFVPDDQAGAVLSALAAQSMTPIEGA